MMHLEGYTPAEIDPQQLAIEDRWMLSRLETVISQVTGMLDGYHYADAARELYDFAWQDFCSFYVEMLKDRLADSGRRPLAQRMLAHCLDQLLRLLHPVMPFITEEIWQRLAEFAPQRGFPRPLTPAGCLIVAAWPDAATGNHDPRIEQQFGLFQSALGAVRMLRSEHNIPPKKQIRFAIRTDADRAAVLGPLLTCFPSMANAECTAIGPEIEMPAIPPAVETLEHMEVIVDRAGLIDVQAERKRLGKERDRLQNQIQGKQAKLGNEKFVANAPDDIVQRERDGLELLKNQWQSIVASLEALPPE